MSQWNDTWLLRFHPEKCKHINIGRKKDISIIIQLVYTRINNTGKDSFRERHCSIYIDDELKFEEHIGKKVKKATQMFPIIRRSFHHLNKKNFIPHYKSLVRTHLDYASSIWSPMSRKLVEQVEGVQ